MRRKHILRTSLSVLFIIVLLVGSLILAQQLSQSDVAREVVQRFGYIGILMLAVISGFNLVVPIPAAIFTPIFLASGLPIVGIILTLALGTTIADLIGYIIGRWGRQSWDIEKGRFFLKTKNLYEKRHRFIIPILFLYAALVPYPNEILVIPLAFLGAHLRTLLIPLFLGSIVYNTIVILGVSGLAKTVGL